MKSVGQLKFREAQEKFKCSSGKTHSKHLKIRLGEWDDAWSGDQGKVRWWSGEGQVKVDSQNVSNKSLTFVNKSLTFGNKSLTLVDKRLALVDKSLAWWTQNLFITF